MIRTEKLSLNAKADAAELAKFAALAENWWDVNGPFQPLHQMNPLRLSLIRDWALEYFSRDTKSLTPFQGLSLLDIGCGGGLLTEPMARLGFTVSGVDAGAEAIAVAIAHANDAGLSIDYRVETAEMLAQRGVSFDAVVALELIEHVPDPVSLVAAIAALVKPGGLIFISTLSRTLPALLLGVIGAEYIARLVPRGTHQWRRFIRPSELGAMLRQAGLTPLGQSGMRYNPLSGEWSKSANVTINYVIAAIKPK